MEIAKLWKFIEGLSLIAIKENNQEESCGQRKCKR